jgi:hypothetical protein
VARLLAESLERAGARVVWLPEAVTGARRADARLRLGQAESEALVAARDAFGAEPDDRVWILLVEGSAPLAFVRPLLSLSTGGDRSPTARALAARADLEVEEPSAALLDEIAVALVEGLVSSVRASPRCLDPAG